MVKTTKKWNLDRDVQLKTRVTGAYWQEERGQWKLTVEHDGKEREEYADILVSGQGFLKYVGEDCPISWRTTSFGVQELTLRVIVSGNGPTSKASIASRVKRSTQQTGITHMTTPTNVSVLSVTVPPVYKYFHSWQNCQEQTLPASSEGPLGLCRE